MNFKTVRYGTSRNILGFFDILFWIGFIASFFVIFFGDVWLRSNFGIPPGFGVVFGVMFVFFFAFCLLIIQLIKSTVDTADYTYQILSVARDQLAVSRAAASGQQSVPSFAGRAEPEVRQQPGFRDQGRAQPTGERAPGHWDYRGHRIRYTDQGAYHVDGANFASPEEAQQHIDAQLEHQRAPMLANRDPHRDPQPVWGPSMGVRRDR